MNNTLSDIATALTNSIAANGETPVTGNLPMNSHKITGLAAPTASGDALAYGSNLTVGNSNDAGATVLDWYLEGTFTPTVTFGGASTGVTYIDQSGKFTRIGNVLTFELSVQISSKGSSTGDFALGGLPYASAASGAANAIMSIVGTGFTGFTNSFVYGRILASTQAVTILRMTNDGASVFQLSNTAATNTMSLALSGSYLI